MSSTQNEYESGVLPETPALRGDTYRPVIAPAVLQTRVRIFSRGAVASWISTLLLAVMFATVAALLWQPVKRSLGHQEANYNEGWNAYHQTMAAKGIPLYGAPSKLYTGSTGYPPLSFHLVGWLGQRIGSCTQAGRALALLAMLAAGIFVGLTVRQATREWKLGVFAFLLYEVGIIVLLPNHVAMNDPQFPAEALCALGLYLYLRDRRSARLLVLSALAFTLAGFFKQSIIAFPLAIGLDLLLESRKSFFLWAGSLVASAGVLTALTLAIDGRYFFQSLTGKRAYLLVEGVKQIHIYLTLAQLPLLVALVWCFYGRNSAGISSKPNLGLPGFGRRTVITLLLLTYAVAFFFAGGFGVDLNVFYGCWLVTVLACGLALAEVDRVPLLNPAVSVLLLMAALFASVPLNFPLRTFQYYHKARMLRAEEDGLRAAVQFVKDRPGPAMCESLLLCYEAGKDYEFDPYHVRGQINAGRPLENDVVEALRTRHFQTVQLAIYPEDQAEIVSQSFAFRNGGYLTSREVQTLLDNYRLALRTPKMLIFVPNG